MLNRYYVKIVYRNADGVRYYETTGFTKKPTVAQKNYEFAIEEYRNHPDIEEVHLNEKSLMYGWRNIRTEKLA